MLSRISYQEVIQFENAQRGSYINLDYRPVFRASAIFFVLITKNINTFISFLNYWREKNNNNSVSALITIRDDNGKKILREFFLLQDFVYQFDMRKMIESVESFIGSCEIELFSNQDLKFSFPAVDAYYESPEGISYVHSNQRVFNDIEDLDRNSKMNNWQSAFDIYVNDQYSGYLSVINGPRLVKDSKAALAIFNINGERFDATVDLGDLTPYATRFILFRDIPKVKEFLKNEVGFCKVNIETFGIFMRIACGNLANDESRMAVTHSFYDCTAQPEYFDASTINPNELACFMPLRLVDEVELDVIFYPIFSPSSLSFSLDCFSSDGSCRASINNFAKMAGAGSQMRRINLRTLLREHNITPENNLYCLRIDEASGKIPMRLPFGMNFRKGALGVNISHSIWMNAAYGSKKRSYLWGALVAKKGASNWLLIAHLSKVKNIIEEAEVTVKIFAKDGPIIEKSYHTKNQTGLNLKAEDLLSKNNYQPKHNEILWYTVESACPNLLANQIHIDPSGFVGGCHSF